MATAFLGAFMSTTPHFKPVNPGGEPWEPRSVRGVSFATAATFSSKSPFRHDDWGREIARPFQLVVMPSYTPPKITPEMERDADFAWYDRPIEKPTIIWDAFSEMALFEMVAEVFRSDPLAGHFRVRKVATKSLLEDIRDPALLALRPKRDGFLPNGVVDPYGYMRAQRTHRAALQRWAFDAMVVEKARGRPEHVEKWSRVSSLYQHMLNKDSVRHSDTNMRESWSETKWREAPHKPLILDSGYTSPVSFMEDRINLAAKGAFTSTASGLEEKARSRSRSFGDAGTGVATSSPSPKPAEDGADSHKGGFWSSLFSS
jgi:hypothetical protein